MDASSGKGPILDGNVDGERVTFGVPFNPKCPFDGQYLLV